MKVTETSLEGAYLLTMDVHHDLRGAFHRVWCKNALSAHNLCGDGLQSSISINASKGTIRGMHYQEKPYEEVKIVSCLKGAIHDVIIDLRKHSPTYLDHFSVTLQEKSGESLYIPKGFAHGFQTLEDDTIVAYMISALYVPESARTIRYNDPRFSIQWPIKDSIILSHNDLNSPYYED
ncbi:dTDP-4-dehydrorhamnose 3,5-epimerase [Fictibacillus macauensis ZFHKF-1]|uniref:dTDP-4-dehydrorhamnose 3,5-epimerase n=1 Tax=Fictibacillus macauensis ZFHKF-1 TaxID=1196324 RepID=I8IYS4_9BACL|nr:dTDP-4-dehydrorhamnose 3,5-epimerase family protein [Fictibacillus macauensis]EIT84626.1 dTDP-4-dehydrorhamnose 3,5-epimerase [Fictibacillus macauensis ZFHKF-1]